MRPSLHRHVVVSLRELLGYKQPGFAQLVGCSLGTLQAVERGPERLKMSPELAEKIFVATGVNPEWLMTNDPTKPMLAHWTGEPYKKELFEAIQARKHLPHGYITELHDTWTLQACGQIFASLIAAQKTSNESALVAYSRIVQFADKMTENFPPDPALLNEPTGTHLIDLVARKVAEFRERDTPKTPPSQPSRRNKRGSQSK